MSASKALSFDALVEVCATYFNNAVEENGFDNFKEMKQSFDWDASDIREEIRALVGENGWMMYDDGSWIVNDNTYEEVRYSYLKKAIFAKVK